MSIFIAFGANLFKPKSEKTSSTPAIFADALSELQKQSIAIDGVSSLWRSPSWPQGEGHPDYLNGAARVQFSGRADELLRKLNETERKFGRIRNIRNAPRTLDLDIIDFEGQIWDTDHLSLPHPRMHRRPFVLFPLAELAPEWTHPITGVSIMDLIGALGPDEMFGFQHAASSTLWYKR